MNLIRFLFGLTLIFYILQSSCVFDCIFLVQNANAQYKKKVRQELQNNINKISLETASKKQIGNVARWTLQLRNSYSQKSPLWAMHNKQVLDLIPIYEKAPKKSKFLQQKTK